MADMNLDESIQYIKMRALAERHGARIQMNVAVTTLVYYSYGWENHMPVVGDIVEINRWYADEFKELVKNG